jgi:hypothetical protein
VIVTAFSLGNFKAEIGKPNSSTDTNVSIPVPEFSNIYSMMSGLRTFWPIF